MIRKDFFEILEKASKQNGGKISIITNGILLNEHTIKEIIKNNVLLLSVSLDGYGKNHDLNRAKDGIWDKIINNFENMNSRSKRSMIDIKTIVLENNLDDLVKLYKMCDEMKFNFLSILSGDTFDVKIW